VQTQAEAAYDFPNLICLKVAQGLVAKAVRLCEIRPSIDSLRDRILQLEDSLSNKRVCVFRDRVVVGQRTHLIDSAAGRLLFRFDLDEFIQHIERCPGASVPRTADQWYEEGVRLEADPAEGESSMAAYREALKLDPALAEAHLNIGRVHYREGRLVDAERSFRMVLMRRPYLSEAHFHLGRVMEDLKCVEDAILSYEKALEIEPDYVEARYHIARACEKVGAGDRAVKHWRRYLALESRGPKAEVARLHLRHLKAELAIG
jgi:tetratricopeptide (TPR) repeat protein